MANKTRSTFAKRQKELARQARQKEKQAKRLEKKAESGSDSAPDTTFEDPDLVGIVAGPQPRADEDDVDDGGETETTR